jgi:hypothetical protein
MKFNPKIATSVLCIVSLGSMGGAFAAEVEPVQALGLICESFVGSGSFVLGSNVNPNLPPPVATIARRIVFPTANAIPICDDVKLQGNSVTSGMGAARFSVRTTGVNNQPLPLPNGIDLTLNLRNAASLPVDETIVVAQIDLDHSDGNSDPNQLSVYATNTNEGLVFQAYVWSGYGHRTYHAASAYDFSGGTGVVNIGVSWDGPLFIGTYRQMSVNFWGVAQQTSAYLVPLGRFDRIDHVTIGSLVETNALTQSAPQGTTPPSITIRAAVRR